MMAALGLASPSVVLLLNSSLKSFHFVTKVCVLFHFIFLWILLLITMVTGLIIGLVILCLTTSGLNQNFHLQNIKFGN
jgi:hypothetical protein